VKAVIFDRNGVSGEFRHKKVAVSAVEAVIAVNSYLYKILRARPPFQKISKR
jgi:hypothetical protein